MNKRKSDIYSLDAIIIQDQTMNNKTMENLLQ